MKTAGKIGLTVAVVAGAVVYMVYTTVSGGEALSYYKQVDEVMAAPAQWQGKPLQLHGNVVTGSIVKKPSSLDYKFGLFRGSQWVEVVYSGLMPDTFKDCAELVVTGKLREDGRTFVGEQISAKCPSKYDGQRRTDCGQTLQKQVVAFRR